MKRFFILIISLLMMLLSTSCGSNSNYVIKKATNDCIIYKLSNNIYDYSTLISYLENNNGMVAFFEKFDVVYYKTLQESFYTVVTTSNGIVQIFFNRDGIYIKHKIISFSCDKYKEGLKNLKIGTSLTDVMKIDPDAHYDFIYASWSKYPQISYHYFSDGNCFAVTYNDNVVSNIDIFTI